MPVYAYKCRDCGTPLEVHQEFSDTALTECPVCGGVLRKQYGSIGVTFNGSGFYRTDSRAGSGDGSGAQPAADGAAKSDPASPAPKTDGGSKAGGGSKADGAKPSPSPSPSPPSTPSSSPA